METRRGGAGVRGRASAREITEALNNESRIAHSTVQTLLRKLERRNAVAHEVEDRTFVFYALVQAEKVARSISREVIDRMHDGSVGSFVCYLLEHEDINESELGEIRRLINEKGNTQ